VGRSTIVLKMTGRMSSNTEIFTIRYKVEDDWIVFYLDALDGRRKMRILLVEDDPDVLLVFEEVLIDAGYEVDTAATFREADNLLGLGEYDLLLSDGRLPDGNGAFVAAGKCGHRIYFNDRSNIDL
jgi:Response regulator receiver domain